MKLVKCQALFNQNVVKRQIIIFARGCVKAKGKMVFIIFMECLSALAD